MVQLLKCSECSNPATHYFFARDFVLALIDHEPDELIYLCDECNKSVSVLRKTYPIFSQGEKSE